LNINDVQDIILKEQKALFLDRDGIINIDHGYVSKIEDFEFTEGVFDLVKIFANKGYLIFVITNQSGIGRGYYSEEDFQKLTAWMRGEFEKNGIEITQVYHCPHDPDEKCRCRKPEIGMIEQASSTYPLNLSHSWMIGDKQSDIDLAVNAGIGHAIYISQDKIENSSYHFGSILDCKSYLEKNQDIIPL